MIVIIPLACRPKSGIIGVKNIRILNGIYQGDKLSI